MSTLADLQALYNTYWQQLNNIPAGYEPPLLQAQLNITAANMGEANTPWTGHAQVDQISGHGWDAPYPAYVLVPGNYMRFNMKIVYSDKTYRDPNCPPNSLGCAQYPFNPGVILDCSLSWRESCTNFVLDLTGSLLDIADPVTTSDGMLYGYVPSFAAAFAFSMRVTPGPATPIIR